MPIVSVVICARNEEGFIEHCLEALKKQTDKPEIIVVDGLSKDRTVEIAKKYADKVISDNGKGIAHARNLGWQNASAGIVAYCDADSRPPADWVENIAKLMNGYAGVHGPITLYDGSKRAKLNVRLWADLFMRLCSKINYPIVCAANVAFRKEMLAKHPFMINAPIEDFEMARRMKHSGRIKCFKELAMPVSARRYEKDFYSKTIRCYLTNYALIKTGREPKNFGYFEKKS